MHSSYICGMEQLLQQIESYKKEIVELTLPDADSLENYRIKFLGTKGILKSLFTEMKNVPGPQKKEFGLILNEFKQLAENKYESGKETLGSGAGPSGASGMDLSLPGDALPLGSLHPIHLFLNHVLSIFSGLDSRWRKVPK